MKIGKIDIINALSVAMRQAEGLGHPEIARRLHSYRENIHLYMRETDQIYLSDLIYIVAKETSVASPLEHRLSSQEQSEHVDGKDPQRKNDE